MRDFYDFGGDRGEAVPIDEFVSQELERRKAVAERPATIARQVELLEGERLRRRARRGEDPADFIGPPNPYALRKGRSPMKVTRG